ncbi:MAG: DUF3157 family protein [Epsilonproteobacteria bacterium]|nr:hypothetical protein [Campylobacterota bacterium]NPA56821.1 DUF3157 family protein [Campylobacterota bacterium]
MRRALLPLLLISLLSADSYVTLDNGKTVHLKDDGTWEEVKVIKKGEKEIVLKNDGTWEEINPKDVESANIITNKADEKFKSTPLGKALLGKWVSDDGDEYLIFTPTTATLKIRQERGFRTFTGKWRIEKLDEKERSLTVNIAEGARLGFVTFGGAMRKLRFSEDLQTLYDESEKLSNMRVYRLHKVR